MKPENVNREIVTEGHQKNASHSAASGAISKPQNRKLQKAQPVPDKLSPDVSGPSGGFVIGCAFDQSAFCAQKKQLLREIVTKSARKDRRFQCCQMHSIIAMVNELCGGTAGTCSETCTKTGMICMCAWRTSAFRSACSRSWNHSRAMVLIGLVLS